MLSDPSIGRPVSDLRAVDTDTGKVFSNTTVTSLPAQVGKHIHALARDAAVHRWEFTCVPAPSASRQPPCGSAAP